MEVDVLSLPDFNYPNILLAQNLDVDSFELNIGHNCEVTMRKPYSGVKHVITATYTATY